jgi:hypothetical protein
MNRTGNNLIPAGLHGKEKIRSMIPDTQSQPKAAGQSSVQQEPRPSAGRLGDPSPIVPTALARQDRPRRRQVLVSQALTMLTLLPVRATSVPRLHVEPRRPDGTLVVLDRFTGKQLMVYTPRFDQQFRAGHRSGRWYVRPFNYVGANPVSQSFCTARGAIDAVTAGHWGLDSRLTTAARQFLVIWSAPKPS